MTDLQQIERSLTEEIKAHEAGLPWAPAKRTPAAACNRQQIVVRLAVRTKRLAPDLEFVHYSDKLSTLEAKIDAEKEARHAGYPIIGYVIDVEKA